MNSGGDGDPVEWGRTLADGRQIHHPPWGPIVDVTDRQPFLGTTTPNNQGRNRMTAIRARWNRISTFNKRAIFITGCMIAMFHAVAVVIAFVEDSSMLIGVVLLDALGIMLFGATLTAERLFPYRSKR